MSIRWLIPFCILILCPQLSWGQQQSGHRYALLIGIGDYRGAKGLDPLHADADTEKLAELLRQQGWTVWLMNSNAPDEKQPYEANILGALGISIEGGGPSYGAAKVPFLGAGARTREDSVLFYYGGHGLQGETDGIDYIIPRDVQFSTTGDILKRTLINLKFVLTALNKTGAGNIIVFTDTCRTTVRTRSANTRKAWKTRGLTGAFTEDPGPAPLQYQRHFFLENSASDEESSYEMDEQSSGVFTYFLRQALAQGQAQSGKCTTLASVAERARSGTINYVQQKLKGAQTPTVLADTSWAESFCLAGAGGSSDLTNLYSALASELQANSAIAWSRVELGGALRTTEVYRLVSLKDCQMSWTLDIQTNENPKLDHYDISVNFARLPADDVKYFSKRDGNAQHGLAMATSDPGIITENRRGFEVFGPSQGPWFVWFKLSSQQDQILDQVRQIISACGAQP